MQVILIEDLAGKGIAGDTIKVADGYARNYLLPRGIAIHATETNLKTLEHRRAKIAERRNTDKTAAEEIAAKIDSSSMTLHGKSGKGGRLFGSITTQDIANEINEIHGIYIDKRKIMLSSPIKQVGVHTVQIKLFTDVIATIRVLVGTPEEIAEAEEANRIAAEKAAARAAAEAEAAARAEAEAAAALAAADAASDAEEDEFAESDGSEIAEEKTDAAAEVEVVEEKADEITEAELSEDTDEEATVAEVPEDTDEEATEAELSEDKAEETTEDEASEDNKEEAAETGVSEDKAEEAEEDIAVKEE